MSFPWEFAGPLFSKMDMFSYSYLAGLAIALYFVLQSIYRLFLSPLRSVPGPWYTAIFSLWFVVHTLRCRQCRVIDELFQKYGPVVRVAPNKVYFLDVQTTKHVYGASAKLSKSKFYKSFQIFDDTDFAITELDHSAHAISKRNYSPHYTSANLALFQPEIHEFTIELVEYLRALDTGFACDVLSMFSHLLIDVNCFHLYNSRVKSLQNWATTLRSDGLLDKADPIKMAIHDYPKRLTLKSVLPYWIWMGVSKLSKGRLRQLCDATEIIAEFVDKEVKQSFHEIQSKTVGLDTKDRMSLITRLLLAQSLNGEVDFKVVVSEGSGNLVASVETTATTLSYIFWELSRRKDILSRLHEELDAHIPDPNIVPDIQILNDLPYLSAVVKEGLRVYTAVPGPLERIVPSKGSSNSAFSLLGHVLPAGTIIATQAWSSHRCADVFENPNRFEPERWMEDSSSHNDEASQSKMQSHMMPFGYGTRICGGQVMAQMMLRIVVAMLARNFDVVAPPETNEKSMAILDSFGIFPASMKCKLIFHPRSK